jgi:hypothetical protein
LGPCKAGQGLGLGAELLDRAGTGAADEGADRLPDGQSPGAPGDSFRAAGSGARRQNGVRTTAFR